jgi:uncharacterized protein
MSLDRFEYQATARDSAGALDVGLQRHMRGVYNTMGLGLAMTGLTAFGIAQVPELMRLLFTTPLFFVAAFAPLGFIFFGFTPGRIARWPAAKLRTMFVVFSVVMGVSMATIFTIFSGVSIARVFFITAGTFAAMSLYGYTTKRSLDRMGSFLFMGMIGIFFAALFNMFFHSPMVQFLVSAIGVVVFTGLTAWQTQLIKETYHERHGDEANAKMAVMGALNLYLSFVNLFQFLLHFMGGSRD